MIGYLTGRNITSGFFWVRAPEDLYCKYQSKLNLDRDCYGWPRKGHFFDGVHMFYRGADREPLSAYKDSDQLAEIRLDELDRAGKAAKAIIFDLADADSVGDYLTDTPRYELIWVREAAAEIEIPAGFISCGFEPSWFPGYFSAVSDSMFLPRWHGADREGIALVEYFRELNRNGLFDTRQRAEQFLAHYLSFDWAEQPTSEKPDEEGAYAVVEVFESMRSNNS